VVKSGWGGETRAPCAARTLSFLESGTPRVSRRLILRLQKKKKNKENEKEENDENVTPEVTTPAKPELNGANGHEEASPILNGGAETESAKKKKKKKKNKEATE